jgi:hypothetical protein
MGSGDEKHANRSTSPVIITLFHHYLSSPVSGDGSRVSKKEEER